MSVKKKLLQNGLASAIQKIIKVAEQLLLVPFFISAWGAAYYGEWLTLTIIPTILGFSDMGFGSAACNSFILKYASGDEKGAADIAKSGFFSIHIIVPAVIILSIFAIFVLNAFGVFEKSLINRNDAMWAVCLLMISRSLNFYLPLNSAFFISSRRVAFSINLISIYSGLNVLSGIGVLLLKGGIVFFALANLIVSVVFTVLYAIIAHRMLHFEVRGEIVKKEIKAIFVKGFGYLLSPVWQAIFFQGSTFVVRLVLGPVAVTIFNTVRTLTRAVNQANSMVISSVIPEIQFELGAGNNSKARQIYKVALITIISIALVGMIFLYFFGPWFYELWTRKALNPPTAMWNILILGIVFNAGWWLWSEMLFAINRPYDFAIVAVIISLIAVVFSYFFAKIWGLTGAAIGGLMLDLLLCIFIFPKTTKCFNRT